MGHFDFLFEDSKSTHIKTGSDQLGAWARSAANRYVDSGALLNDTIRKIATENDLNSEQIHRVCEMANIDTHKSLWPKTAQKEALAFPLADAQQVVEVMTKKPMDGADPGGHMVSPCSSHEDYSAPPSGIPAPGPSIGAMMGVDSSKVHNGLHEEPEKKQIIIILEKKAAAREALASKILYNGMQLETLEKQAWLKVKDAVLQGESFGRIYQAAVGSGLGKTAEEYLPEWEERLISETYGDQRRRLEKLAIGKSPEDLISGNMGNVTVINGAHPVLISLDTLAKKTGEVKQGLNNLLRIDDEVKVYSQRMREL